MDAFYFLLENGYLTILIEALLMIFLMLNLDKAEVVGYTFILNGMIAMLLYGIKTDDISNTSFLIATIYSIICTLFYKRGRKMISFCSLVLLFMNSFYLNDAIVYIVMLLHVRCIRKGVNYEFKTDWKRFADSSIDYNSNIFNQNGR